MPVIKHLIGEHRNDEAVKYVVNYIRNSPYLWNCGTAGLFLQNTDSVCSEFAMVKRCMGNEGKKLVHHMIIGFEKHKGWTVFDVEEIAFHLAQILSQRFQVFYGVHRGTFDDPDYLHIHMAINSVSYADGKRFYESNSHFAEIAVCLKTLIPGWYCKTVVEECDWEDENLERAF